MSSNTSSHAPQLGEVEIGNLVGLGFLIQLIAGPANETMITIIHRLSKLPPSNLTFLEPALSKHGLEPTMAVGTLEAVLPKLPLDNEATRRMTRIAILMGVTTLVVALRFYARRFLTKQIRAEDWACLAALVSVQLIGVSYIVLDAKGHKGVHLYALTQEQVRSQVLQVYIDEPLFVMGHFFTKLTFLVFYHGLSPARGYRYAVYAVAFFVAAYTISGLSIVLLQCRPIDYWNHLLTAKCLNRIKIFPLFGSMYIVGDILLLILPMNAVYRLQLRWREKAVVMCIFGMGVFICIASINRVILLRDWLEAKDFSREGSEYALWAYLEFTLSVIISCLPALKVFITCYTKKPSSTVLSAGIEDSRERSGSKSWASRKESKASAAAVHKDEYGLTVYTVDGDSERQGPGDSRDALHAEP